MTYDSKIAAASALVAGATKSADRQHWLRVERELIARPRDSDGSALAPRRKAGSARKGDSAARRDRPNV